MEHIGTKTQADCTMLFAGEAYFDPIEAGVRHRVRGFVEPRGSPDIQELLEQEFATALGEAAEGGGTQEWRNASLPRYARITRQVERKGGRPKVLEPAKQRLAVQLYAEKPHTVVEICRMMEISKPTLSSYVAEDSG